MTCAIPRSSPRWRRRRTGRSCGSAIWTGFALAFGFGVLAAAAAFFELTPWRWAFVALVSIKLLTNSLAWLALARDRFVLETQALNTTADVVLLTGAIYFTGGPYSRSLATYVIVIAVHVAALEPRRSRS